VRTVTTDHLREVRAAHEAPCISLYQPTHRHHPDNKQDPIRFRNLVDGAEASLRRGYPNVEVRRLLGPFRDLADDQEFWNHTLDGLAVLGSRGTFRVFPLQRAVPELTIVADSFHLKPLVRIIQSADRYQVLCLGRREAKLYEGNRDALDEVDLAEGVPRTIAEALGDELTEPHRTVASSGGAALHHGHGSKKDEVDSDAERFFRAVDRAILEHHSRPSGLPLVLASLTEYHDVFRRVSHNPLLAADGIGQDPGSLSIDRLREEAWKVMQPHYLRRLSGLVTAFEEARSKRLATGDLSDAAREAVAGRVGMLLVDADRHVPGTLDPATGSIAFDDLAHPEVDDMLDDLAELVLNKGGEVVIVPSDRMPTESGLAAIYRF
jgi:Bacterial archaeo-eukaryotic release factor family 3